MLRLSGLSMQTVRDSGGYPRMTLLICWERVSGSVTLSGVTCDAGSGIYVPYKCDYSPMKRLRTEVALWF